jgi:putative inorganic carbon (hco3(-)) transporter
MTVKPNNSHHSSSVPSWIEPACLALSAPAGFIPERLPPFLVIALLTLAVLPAGIRLCSGSVLSVRSPLNGFICVFLLVLLPMSLWASPLLRESSFPHAARFAWSVALFFAVLNLPWTGRANDNRKSSAIVWSFLLFGACGLLIGLTGMPISGKFPFLLDAIGAHAAIPDSSFRLSPWFQPNEIAGLAVLLLPVSLGLLLGVPTKRNTPDGPDESGDRKRPELRRVIAPVAFAIITATVFAVLILTQSRGGVMAAMIACAVMLVLAGKRGLILLGLGLTTVLALGLLAGADRILNALFLAGKNSGVSWDHLLTGRLEIWSRAIFAILDFPLTGIGIGTFESVVTRVYPFAGGAFASFPPDAHNALLQEALDFGVPGLILFAAVMAIALRSLARSIKSTAAGEAPRFLVAGLAGAFVGFLVHGLTDTIAFGAPYNVALWFLLALIMRSEARTAPKKERARRAIRAVPFVIALVLLAGGALLHPVRDYLKQTIASRDALKAIVSGNHSAPRSIDRAIRNPWLAGMLYHVSGDSLLCDSAWAEAIETMPSRVPLLACASPRNRHLAELAVERRRNDCAALFWLADFERDCDTARAIGLYRRGLSIDATDGLRWRYLGDLLRPADPRAAMRAYLQSCAHGDPGGNGCLLAGRTAEGLGDTLAAISYYRRSNYFVALARADTLEKWLHSR